jgi:hypothetical protein
VSETDGKLQIEAEEFPERSSRNPKLRLRSITTRKKEEEVLEVDTMVEETIFLEEEEEAEENK